MPGNAQYCVSNPEVQELFYQDLIDAIAGQSDAQSGADSIRDLERIRDNNLVTILRGLKAQNWGAGKLLNAQDKRINHLPETLDDVADLSQPFVTVDRAVPLDWTDYNGHMNEARYLQAFGDATADQVRWVGAIGADPGVIVVAKDSPFQNLGDMVAAIKADPGSVAFAGGSAAGGFDHMKPLQVMKSAGFSDITKVKYIGVDGGADAITQTIGGHTQAMTGDMSEIVGFIKSGDVRVLAVLTEARVPGFEDIPTAREQGFDVVAVNWRGLYVPKGISDDQFNAWATKLQAVADSAEWKETMTANGLAPFTKVGTDFQGWVDGVIAETETLSREIGVIQ